MLRRQVLPWRNRLISNPRFRALANRLWPARWVARNQARELFDIIAGFTYSQILLACVRLDLFTRLKASPQSAAALASSSELDEAAWQELLLAAESLQLVANVGRNEFTLGRLGAVVAADRSIQAMVLHHDNLYRDLVDPVALLQGQVHNSALGEYWPYATKDSISPEAAQRYSSLMAASQPMVAEQVTGAFDFTPFKTIMDVGGGNGAFLRAVAAAAPHLSLRLFDLPPVADLARDALAKAGLAARCEVHGGDFRADELPTGADLISLIRIAHDHNDDTVLLLLEKIHRSLMPGGTLLIAEPMAGTAHARRMGDAYFRLYLKAMGTGRPRTFDELKDLLQRSGFAEVQSRATAIPMLARVVTAQRDT